MYLCVMTTFCIQSPEEIPAAAKKIVEFCGQEKIILFCGQMGAGKTTLIKSICRLLGVKDETSSPTFAIINQYHSPSGPVYHFDCYRLKNEKEAWETGCEEYFHSGHWCLVEWPEIIYNLLPGHYVKVEVIAEPDQTRTLTLTKQA